MSQNAPAAYPVPPEHCSTVRQSGHGWHLKREIQVGHIITTVGMLASVAAIVIKMDQRLVVVETKQSAMEIAQIQRDDRQDLAARESLTLLRSQLGRMDEKLDRLIERGVLRR